MGDVVRIRVPTTTDIIVDFGHAETEAIGTVAVSSHGRLLEIYQLRTWREDIMPHSLRRRMRASSMIEYVRAVIKLHPDYTDIDIRVVKEIP